MSPYPHFPRYVLCIGSLLYALFPAPLHLYRLSSFLFESVYVTDVYKRQAILQDLTDCVNEPNLPGKYNSGDSNYGRVTKGAAYADVYKRQIYFFEF